HGWRFADMLQFAAEPSIGTTSRSIRAAVATNFATSLRIAKYVPRGSRSDPTTHRRLSEQRHQGSDMQGSKHSYFPLHLRSFVRGGSHSPSAAAGAPHSVVLPCAAAGGSPCGSSIVLAAVGAIGRVWVTRGKACFIACNGAA